MGVFLPLSAGCLCSTSAATRTDTAGAALVPEDLSVAVVSWGVSGGAAVGRIAVDPAAGERRHREVERGFVAFFGDDPACWIEGI